MYIYQEQLDVSMKYFRVRKFLRVAAKCLLELPLTTRVFHLKVLHIDKRASIDCLYHAPASD